MKKLSLALALFALARIPAYAEATPAERTAVMVPINRFLDGFNAGDPQKMLAAGSDQMSVIDEFPPHEWHGTGAFAKWMSDYDTDAKKKGITDGFVKFGPITHLDVSGDWAYVVIPADHSFKQNGKPVGEVGSIITVTPHNGTAGWLITGWAWAKH
jgi:hypothetical protein